MSYTPDDLKALAQTAWGEARGEGLDGMRAVMWVIVNRVEDSRWPNSVFEVVHQRWQFSAWNPGNPNRERMEQVNENDAPYDAALGMGRVILEGLDREDPTFGANHYFADSIVAPDWAREMTHTATIGNHRFYRDL
jgi:spore germination cell wall hydrolase CwlJ-like protein